MLLLSFQEDLEPRTHTRRLDEMSHYKTAKITFFVISVLLYGSEILKLTDAQLGKFQVFRTTYTRQILDMRW